MTPATSFVINSSTGGDTFIWGKGDGNDLINDASGSTVEIDTLRFLDVNPDDVTLSQSGSNLLVTIKPTGEAITINGQYFSTTANYGIDRIVFADATVWDRTTIGVAVLNRAPTAVNDSFAAILNTNLVLAPSQLLANDTDPDGNALILRSVGAATHGVVSKDAQGNVVFAPDANYVGPASFTYTIADGYGGTATATVALTVAPLNHAPVITSNGGGATAAVSVAENTTAVTTVVATDQDPGTTLTYSISGGADASKFVINATSGALAFASAPNYEGPTDAAPVDNVYNVTVQVSAGAMRGSTTRNAWPTV